MANKVNRKSLLIGIGCMFFQQISGINAIIFYMGYIFNKIGSSITTNTSVIAVGIVQVVFFFFIKHSDFLKMYCLNHHDMVLYDMSFHNY